jgi:hypothetical protein
MRLMLEYILSKYGFYSFRRSSSKLKFRVTSVAFIPLNTISFAYFFSGIRTAFWADFSLFL